MTNFLPVAAVQLSATAAVRDNLATVQHSIREAASAGARVVVCPEAAMVRFGASLADAAQPLDGPFAQGVRDVAAECGVLAVVGMFTPAPDGRVQNTLVVTGAGVETSYAKIHLYDAFGSRESDTVAPGHDLVTFAAFGTVFGLATCYDLRFAAHFTELGRAGAHVVLVPASWGDGPGKAEQWDLLTRARAMDAQAWVVAADQAWTAPQGADPLGVGRSVVVDPLGVVRARLSHESGTLHANISPDIVAGIRARVPIL